MTLTSNLSAIDPTRAEKILNLLSSQRPADERWKEIIQHLKREDPFSVHLAVFQENYRNWGEEKGPAPAWIPDADEMKRTHLFSLMKEKGFSTYSELFKWSVECREEFWKTLIEKLQIQFHQRPEVFLDLQQGPQKAQWLPGARLNIAESCFQGRADQTAIVYQTEGGPLQKMTYLELDQLSNQVANGLVKQGFQPGDRIAIDMVMTKESVALYLGIVKAGCAAVSIADSFSASEIQTRLRISEAKAIFTQDVILRGGKELPLYSKVVEAGAERIFVIPAHDPHSLETRVERRSEDQVWEEFLSSETSFQPVPRDPEDCTNVLFSSGTTGDPKAIPWTHLTPIKAAADGYLHHDIHEEEVVAWPTNLGWMMGPWLIYASLLNRGALALYYGAPLGREFGEFVQNAKVNMLGLVPSVVKAWRNTGCMKDLDWSAIKVLSSTGEASNAEDYLFLMSLANYRPVIEYCGGTEIGGGYITGTLLQAASPATFTTPSLGLDLFLLDESGKPSSAGEVFLVPPSIGLSNTLLNRDHFKVYYAGLPNGPEGKKLRRHGDQMERLSGGFFRAQGRADDTMNLGGIKVSSAEIERVVNRVEGVLETAAIALNPASGGPSELVICVVLKESQSSMTSEALLASMQKKIKTELNPLFKIHQVEIIEKLPRTASNKVMRRVLRSQFSK